MVNKQGRVGFGRWWTLKEVEQVREWQAQGVPIEEQGRRLSRSYASMASGIARYKLKGHPHTNYDPDKRLKVIAFLQKGLNQAQIAKLLGDKCHTHVSIIVRDLERRKIVKRLGRCGPYVVTAEWG